MKQKIYLIDGNAYIHRAFHAIPLLTTNTGLPINAVYGFVRMIFKALKNFKPLYLCICLDSDKPTFRHKIFKEYKATRKELDENIKIQFPIVAEFVELSGIPHLRYDGYEADDIICSLVNKFKNEYEIVIISGDKDILQLVDENVTVYNEHKDIWYDEKTIDQKYGVPPRCLVDYFTLVGDKIDNIAGLPGVGPKTAAELLRRFGSIDNIYSSLEKLKPDLKDKFLKYKDVLYKSRQLIELNPAIEEVKNISVEDIKIEKLNIAEIKQFLVKYEMKSIIKELNNFQDQKVSIAKDDLFDWAEKNKNIQLTVSTPQVFYVDNTNIYNILNMVANTEVCVSLMLSKETEQKISSCIGYAMSENKKIYFYVPLVVHKTADGEEVRPVDKKNFLEFVTSLLFKFTKSKFITYNIKLQLSKLFVDYPDVNLTLLLTRIYDLQLLSHLIDPNKKLTKLQDLVDTFTPNRIVADIVLPNEFNFSVFPVEKLVSRMIDTLETIYDIYNIIQAQMEKYELYKVYETLELPLIKVLLKMERNGIKVDDEYLKELKKELETEIVNCKSKIFEHAGVEFNLNSPKQLAFILFEKLRLPPIKKKKTGYSTDEEVLQKLKDVHPIIPLILRYRELEKLINTYIEPLAGYVNPITGRVHTVFNPVGTATGRLSSENPNMQNIPVKTDLGKKIRQIFIPEKKFKFVSFDYSQIELRILAHLSKDKSLIQSFLVNKDIHRLTAAEVFGIDETQVNDDYRRVGKIINFGIIYGITPQGLAKELNIPVELAENYIFKYFQKYPSVKEWTDKTIKFAKLNGYVKTLFGRIRPIPEINSTNKQICSFGERLAVNTPVQGTAADIIKLAMIKIDEYIENENLTEKVKMLLQIHDELLFEIHEDVLSQTVEQIKNIMEKVVELEVPIVVDVSIFNRWGES